MSNGILIFPTQPKIKFKIIRYSKYQKNILFLNCCSLTTVTIYDISPWQGNPCHPEAWNCHFRFLKFLFPLRLNHNYWTDVSCCPPTFAQDSSCQFGLLGWWCEGMGYLWVLLQLSTNVVLLDNTVMVTTRWSHSCEKNL